MNPDIEPKSNKLFGITKLSRSISEAAINKEEKKVNPIKFTKWLGEKWEIAKIFEVINIAVINSTNGYWNEILDLQNLHLPFKNNQDIIGIFKNQGIFFLHFGQKLLG